MTDRPLRLLVDMDGPLADFDLHFWNRSLDRGFTFDVPHHSHQRHRYFTDHLPDRRERRAARDMVDSPGWFENLPVVPGAVDGMKALCEVADVWVCTKPLEVNPTCRDAKAAWLAEHFGGALVSKLVIAPDKSMVRGDVLLDDAPKPEWYASAEWRPVIYTAPYNGVGSTWEDLPHWTWADGVDQLLTYPKDTE